MGGGQRGEQAYPKQEPAPVVTPAPQPVEPPPVVAPSPLRVCGIDVAKYQDKLDPVEWKLLFTRGYRYVYAKASDGKAGVDPYFKAHRKGGKEAGFIFGAYHYFRFGYDGAEQARHFFQASGGQLLGELPPALDVEWDRYTLNQRYGEGKRMDEAAVGMVKKCAVEIERLFGVKPIIYTNAFFWPERIAHPEDFLKYLCWIPSYADSHNPGGQHELVKMKPEDMLRAGEKVKVPHPWKQWDFWQDDDDLVTGDVQAIDTDLFRGSLEDLRKLTRQK